ncbi:MAG: GNAT family N-acetyltransferase [Leptolyngbyaceae cyanobacterium]
MPYRVRPAVYRDLHQLADILTRSFYGTEGWQSWIYPLLRIGIYEDLKQRFRHAPPHYVCLAGITVETTANQQDWIVGTVELAPKSDFLWRKQTGRQLYLSNLAVREAYRRTGVARQLLKACEQTAQADGFTELYLHVMENNQAARQLYEQAGYHLEQAEMNWLTLFGQPRRLRLRKVLSNMVSSAR